MPFLRIVGLLSCAAFLVALTIGLTASFGTRFGYWNYHVGLEQIFPWSIAIGALAFACGVVWVATALAKNVATAGRFGLTGFLGSFIVLAVPLASYWQSYGKPPIHDISTDVEH